MNLLDLIKSEKEVSPLDMEKQDVIYEAWEMGRLIAKVLEVCFLIKWPLAEGREEGFLIKDVGDSLYRLKVLYEKLNEKPPKILGWTEESDRRIKSLPIKDILKSFKPDEVLETMNLIENLIGCELKAQSTHLFSVFSFSLILRKLKTGLLYELEKEGRVESLIKQSLDILEKIKCGDKVLISPHMELSNKNLRIIKGRIEGWKKCLPELRKYSIKIGSYSKEGAIFIKNIEETCNMWEELVLDIKNPSDYLCFWKKLWNFIIPLIICYYIFAIPIVLIPWEDLNINKDLVAFLTPIALIGFLVREVYRTIRNWREIRSFKFKVSDLKKIRRRN